MHNSVAFGIIKGTSNGVIEQKITIPHSGVEGIRHELISLVSQSALDIKPFEPEPSHENTDSPK